MALWIEEALGDPAHTEVSDYSQFYLWLGGKLPTAGKRSHICALDEPKPPHSSLLAPNCTAISQSYANAKERSFAWESHSSAREEELFVASGLGHWRWARMHSSFRVPFSELWTELADLLGKYSQVNMPFQRKINHTHPGGGQIQQATYHPSFSPLLSDFYYGQTPNHQAPLQSKREDEHGAFWCEHTENSACGSFPRTCYLEASPSAEVHEVRVGPSLLHTEVAVGEMSVASPPRIL